jgi:hypothetical protein
MARNLAPLDWSIGMRFAFVAAFGLLSFCGCTANHPVHTNSGLERIGNGTVSWDSVNGEVCLIIWDDQLGKDMDPSSYFLNQKWDATNGSVELHRSQRTVDGRKFELRATLTNNGKMGAVEINGEKFQLSDGQIFLTSTRDPKRRTVQVHSELTGFQPTRGNLEKLARDNAVIKAFVDSLKAQAK